MNPCAPRTPERGPGSRKPEPLEPTHLRPRAEVLRARVEDLADRDRGVDQADVGIGLRKIAEQAAGRRLDVFGEQAERIGVAEQAIEQRSRASSTSPIIASASTHQNEQIENALVVSPKSSSCR